MVFGIQKHEKSFKEIGNEPIIQVCFEALLHSIRIRECTLMKSQSFVVSLNKEGKELDTNHFQKVFDQVFGKLLPPWLSISAHKYRRRIAGRYVLLAGTSRLHRQ